LKQLRPGKQRQGFIRRLEEVIHEYKF